LWKKNTTNNVMFVKLYLFTNEPMKYAQEYGNNIQQSAVRF